MPKTLITTDYATKILKKWKKGARVPEIAKELELRPAAIYQFLYRLRKNGHDLEVRKAGRPSVASSL